MSYVSSDFAPTAPHPASAGTRILVLGRTPGLAARVAASLEGEPGVAVRHRDATLAGAEPWLAEADLAVFECAADPAADMAALRALPAPLREGMRFLALVPGALSQAMAQDWIDAGAAEVLPVSALAGAPVTAPAPAAGPVFHSIRRDRPAAPPPMPAPAPEAPQEAAKPAGRVIAVMRARGGAGATTLAVTLAATLAARPGQRVALVDLDIQNGSVAVQCDLPEAAAFTALIRARDLPGDGFLDAAMTAHEAGFSVLTAPDEFAPLTALTPGMAAALMDALQRRFDHVIVDLPQAVLDWFEPVLGAASRALIVTETSVPAIKGTRRLMDLIAQNAMTLPVEVVVNRESRPFALTAAHKEAMRVLDQPLTHWMPADPRAARRAADLGRPLPLCARRSGICKTVAKLAGRLTAQGPKEAK